MSRWFAVAILALSVAVAARADSIDVGQVGVLQSEGFNTVVLTTTGNPVIGPTILGGSLGVPLNQADLIFEAAILSTPTPTLSNWTFTLFLSGLGTFTTSNSFNIYCYPGTNCQWELSGEFFLPRDIYHPIPGTINFSFNGVSSGPLSFTYVAPAPEPSTLLLCASGVLAIGLRMKKRLS
jgi:hypothetical protein